PGTRHQVGGPLQEGDLPRAGGASAEGKVLYQLSPYDGREFKSPSSLGSAVTGKACNGWTFWSVDTSDPETDGENAAAPKENEAPAAGEQEPAAGSPEFTGESEPEEPIYVPLEEDMAEPPALSFRRVPNQRGVDDGLVRLYCDDCQASFTAPLGERPDSCPQGHQPS
ncbi:MAG TPA: hypothetical protein VFA32_15060, partial [Dehalococcoidia bacterium]|nr:hypothetical protein [Dehalococcoidia bacterium]